MSRFSRRAVGNLLRTLDVMATFDYPIRGKSFARSTVLLLAVAGAGYVAGAFSHNTESSRDDSASFARPAFARPVQAAESNPRGPLSASGTATPAVVDWSHSDGVRVSQPRECDLAQGISTECMFLD